MEKAYRAVRLIWALLLAFEAGLRVRKQMMEQAAEVAEGVDAAGQMPDVGEAMARLHAKLGDMVRRAAERAGAHNDGPGSD